MMTVGHTKVRCKQPTAAETTEGIDDGGFGNTGEASGDHEAAPTTGGEDAWGSGGGSGGWDTPTPAPATVAVGGGSSW